jgi:hypothetical protein
MSKKLDYFRCKINDIGLCCSVKNEHNNFYNELMEIFKLHPNYPEIFLNVVDVAIAYNKINPKKCYELQLIKSNKTSEAISYRKCFVKTPTKDIDLKHAMRYAIKDQILDYKDSCDELICAICGSEDYIQIDHVILFKTLYDDFLSQNTLTIPTEFDNTYFNSAKFKNDDVEFKKSWYEYHKKHAILRCLCNKCNLTRSKK